LYGFPWHFSVEQIMGTPSAEVPVVPAGEHKAPGVTLPPDRGWVACGDVVGAALAAGGRVVGGAVGREVVVVVGGAVLGVGAVVVVARSVVAGRSVVVVESSSAAPCSRSLPSGSPAITTMAPSPMIAADRGTAMRAQRGHDRYVPTIPRRPAGATYAGV
jgi:hypothetical protein